MKRLFVLLCALFISLAFGSCERSKTEEPNMTKATEMRNSVSEQIMTSQDSGGEDELILGVESPPEYSGTDWAAYLEWLETHLDQEQISDGQNELNNTVTEAVSIMIPVLQSNEYRFCDVMVNQYSYSYFYAISEDEEANLSEGQFDFDTGITVTVSREEDSFDAILDQFDLVENNGVAYNYSRNTWYIENDGKWISVHLPGTVTVEEASEIDEYITFEAFSSSGDDATLTE